jgi:aspartyl protease family protein
MTARRRLLWILIAAAILIGLTVAYLGGTVMARLESRDDRIHFVYLGLLLVFLLSSAAVRWRQRPVTHLRHALVWASVALVLVIAYSFRFEIGGLFTRVKGELLPGFGVEAGPGRMAYRADRSGHFRVVANVNGTPIRFLVDTGASLVVLSPNDAARIGQDPARLLYGQTFRTANGIGRGAAFRINELRIGEIVLRDVRASINAAPMSDSLLGMSALEKLSGFSVENGVLTLVK